MKHLHNEIMLTKTYSKSVLRSQRHSENADDWTKEKYYYQDLAVP